MSCPHCNAVIAESALECSTCGILFSKWKEREENVASGNLSRYASLANATSSSFNWTILVIVCVVILGVFYFMGHNAAE